MVLIQSDVGRLFVFIVVTIAEVLLTIFLLAYGSENLKFFAMVLLIIQFFAIYKIYLYLSYFGHTKFNIA